MHKAKSTLSQLVQRAAAGETILIGAYGKVDAKLVAATLPTVRQKRIGILAGKLTIPDDFDAPLPDEVLAAFEGGQE
jgi:antitoxin (DNA-binding transcriptional repressor) of toxin-antitoxin stability system